MRSGRTVDGAASEIMRDLPTHARYPSHQMLNLSEASQKSAQTSFSQIPSSSSSISQHLQPHTNQLVQQQHERQQKPSVKGKPKQLQTKEEEETGPQQQHLYDEASEEEWSSEFRSFDLTTVNQYSKYLEKYEHALSCEKSRTITEVQQHHPHEQSREVRDDASIKQHRPRQAPKLRSTLFCCKRAGNRSTNKIIFDNTAREKKSCHCGPYNHSSYYKHECNLENNGLNVFPNEHEYYDYYYVQGSSEEDMNRRLTRRSSDFELHMNDHKLSLPILLRGHRRDSSITKFRKSSHKRMGEDQRLTRSLEELPRDIKEHILHCRCSCDHLGYGNYSTLSLKEFPGNSWAMASTESDTGTSGHPQKHESLIKYKQKELEIRYHIAGVVCLVLVLAGVAGVGVSVPLALKTSPTPTAAPVEDRQGAAKNLLSETPLVDGHNDLPWNIRKFMHNRLHSFNMSADLSSLRPWSRSSWSHTDIPRLRRGHVGAQFWVSYVPCESQYLNAVQLTIEQIDLIKRLVNQYPNDLQLATSSDDIDAAFREGRIASLIGVEGGHAIQNSLGVLRALHDLGVRYMTLTHTCSTPWAECARNSESDSEDPNSPRGLTQFGKTVVREMNRLGLAVDLSHVSQETMRAALEVTRSPVLFSHSSVYAICKNPRNVPDDILKEVASNGGLVMVSFYTHFLTCSQDATVKDVIDHINHVRSVAGVDHVGIGADFDGVNKLPTGLEDVSKYPNLFAELMQDPTWTNHDLKKLAGLNLLRVLRDVEKVAKELKNEHIGPYEEDVPYSQIKVKDDCTYRFLKDDSSYS